jgi:hypothetical protein
MRSTLELFADLLSEVRHLIRVELSLVRTEIGERSAGIPSNLAALVVGVVLLPVALGLILVAGALFLTRFGLPTDAAFLILALVAILASFVLLRLGATRLKPSRLVPAKSLAQISSLLGGAEPCA